MKNPLALAFAAAFVLVPAARAHITPPVRLASEREAVTRLLAGATRHFVREVRLSAAQRQTIGRRTGWSADDDYYRFYVGRTAGGAAVASAVFLSDFTIHGPVRVAVALAPGGKVKAAAVVEVSEEAYHWVKPLLQAGFLEGFAGADAGSASSKGAGGGNSMERFYARVIAGLVARAAVLYEVAVGDRGP